MLFKGCAIFNTFFDLPQKMRDALNTDFGFMYSVPTKEGKPHYLTPMQCIAGKTQFNVGLANTIKVSWVWPTLKLLPA